MDEKLFEMIKAHEGLRLRLYQCPSGKQSIGFGRNLQDNGISLEEANLMLFNDVQRSKQEASTFPWFQQMNDFRKVVIITMIFNLGMPKFLTFKRMIQSIEMRDYVTASNEMLRSVWASQVGKRAVELALIMKTGVCV